MKDFFPSSQLFGFTGTPIFKENATVTQIKDEQATLKTTEDIFNKELHSYTITDAIEDKNVLRFNIDHYKPDADIVIVSKQSIVKAIIDKHNISTFYRKYNAIFATNSINEAIEYYNLFKIHQEEKIK